MIKLNVGDLVKVKEPETEDEKLGFTKGIGYVKRKTRATGKYSIYIVIQWVDDPQEEISYTRSGIEFLIKHWIVYRVVKDK